MTAPQSRPSVAVVTELESKALAARRASRDLARASTQVKDRALNLMADGIVDRQSEILDANAKDVDAGTRGSLPEAVLGRLRLDRDGLESIARDLRRVAALSDPIGETFDMRTLPTGLQAGKRRVPLGVIGAIYESRPNVTVDIASLCLKAGNAVILRGGKEAINSNTALATVVKDAVAEAGLPADAVQFIESPDRALVAEMLKLKEYIDLIIPRGGADLIRRVAAEAAMPAITGGVGVCHVYVDRAASVDMAVPIVNNAKVTSPYVCNAMDTVIVHSSIAPAFLQRLADVWRKENVEMRCDRRALTILGPIDRVRAVPAEDEDWGTEFLAMTAAVKVVDSLDEALGHIEDHGSGHTEAIVTEDYSAAMRFLDEVDSAVVLVNASTRFNDGGELGLGAEVAISTNKMHARGPMGLRELTSYKWTVLGSGQVRE